MLQGSFDVVVHHDRYAEIKIDHGDKIAFWIALKRHHTEYVCVYEIRLIRRTIGSKAYFNFTWIFDGTSSPIHHIFKLIEHLVQCKGTFDY